MSLDKLIAGLATNGSVLLLMFGLAIGVLLIVAGVALTLDGAGETADLGFRRLGAARLDRRGGNRHELGCAVVDAQARCDVRKGWDVHVTRQQR